MDRNIKGLLGLAFKGGNAAIGDNVLDGLQKKRVVLVLLAHDASGNTLKKWQDKCAFYQVPCLMLATKEDLGQAIGKKLVSVIAIRDRNLAGKIEKLMKDGDIYGTKKQQEPI